MKFSSFKKDQLIMECWREYLNEQSEIEKLEKELLNEGLGLLNEGLWQKIKAAAQTAIGEPLEKINKLAMEKFIAVTSTLDDWSMSLQTFMDKYIPKPMQKALLLALIAAMFALKKPEIARALTAKQDVGMTTFNELLHALSGPGKRDVEDELKEGC